MTGGPSITAPKRTTPRCRPAPYKPIPTVEQEKEMLERNAENLEHVRFCEEQTGGAEGRTILKGQPHFYLTTCFWSWWKDESKRTRKRQWGRKTGYRWTKSMCLPKMWYEDTSHKRCTMSSGQMSQLWI